MPLLGLISAPADQVKAWFRDWVDTYPVILWRCLEPATYSHEQMWDLRIWPRHTCGGVKGLDLRPLGGDSKLVGGIVESPHSHEAAPQGITHQVTPGGGHVWRGSPGVGVGIVHLDRGQRVVVVGSVAACSSSPALGFGI